jgi:RNA ligase
MLLEDVIDLSVLNEMLAARYVRETFHPTLPYSILNYTAAAQYDRVWNPVVRACRGLIWHNATGEVLARPFPKFHNYGEHEEGALDLEAPAVVTEKLDGSLGILYPTPSGHAVATRGSFASEQALHATALWRRHYEQHWRPEPGLTYLFEIVYPGNRVVVDYGDRDDLVLVAVLDVETGLPASPTYWPGPRAREHPYRTLAEALAAPPRENSEGLVVYLPATNERVKIKQDDYVALHRILTGTNARNVWEVAAVRACAPSIRELKHWGTYLGIDPARAEEVLALGDDWLESVPDEFYAWVGEVRSTVESQASERIDEAVALVIEAAEIPDRFTRFQLLRQHPMQKEIMRLTSWDEKDGPPANGWAAVTLKSWRLSCPAPTAPFARSEDVA